MKPFDCNHGPSNHRKDICIIIILCGLITALMAPALLGWYPKFSDDIAFEWYPHLVFVARSFAQGIIPWWDPHTFCGASPEYLHGTYQITPHWLLNFLLLRWADWNKPASVYFWGIKFPTWLGYILGVIGAYLLGRKGFRLNRAGSAFLSLAYGFSPSVISMFHNAFSLVAFPWWILAVIAYARSLRMRWLALGSLVFALLTPTYVVQVVHALTVAGLFVLGIVIWEVIQSRFRRAISVAAGCLLMILLGALLVAPWWWCQWEISRQVNEQQPITVESITAGYRSVPPRYFASLFVPWVFDANGAHHTWNVTRSISLWANEARLIRGLPLMLLAFLAVAGLLSGRGGEEENDREYPLRLWIILSLITALFALVMLAGSYTPFYRWLFPFIPIFRVPYADRWHPTLAFGIALLGGIGVHLLTLGRIELTKKLVLIFAAMVLAIVGVAIIWPFNDGRTLWFPAFRQLTSLGELGWFIKGPLLYLVAGLVGLFVLSIPRLRRWGIWLVFALAALEIFILAAAEVYISRIPGETLDKGAVLSGEDESAFWQLPSVSGPGECKTTRFASFSVEEWRNSWPLYRTAYFRSILDNGALINGSFSLLGHVSKPLLSRFYRTVAPLVSGFPYELHLNEYASPFLTNMSVRYLWLDRPAPPDSGLVPVPVENELGLELYRNENALPRVFTLDRFHAASEGEQRFYLLHRDLRRAVIVDQDDYALKEILPFNRLSLKALVASGISREELEHFRRLQEINRIQSFDFNDPNRVIIDIQVKQPALLVVTDVWHPDWKAAVDGEPVPISRVNYLQRGVWLNEGMHRVELRFKPRAIYGGVILSVLGLSIVGILIIADSIYDYLMSTVNQVRKRQS